MNILTIIKGFSIFGLDIKFYGLIIAFGMLFGVIIACKNAKLRNLVSDDIITLAIYVLPLAILGARAYFVLFSEHSYTFVEFFQIWNGGMAIYGGVIGGAVGVVLYCLIHKKNFLNLADVAAVSLIFGQALGRWGNFFNQEAYGYAVTNPSLQWFPFAVLIEGSGWHLATFFYESLWNIIVFVVLMILIKKTNIKGVVMCFYFILYGAGRLFIEGLRTDSLYIGTSSVRVSQLLSGILIVAFFAVLLWLLLSDRNKRLQLQRSTGEKQTKVNNDNTKIENKEVVESIDNIDKTNKESKTKIKNKPTYNKSTKNNSKQAKKNSDKDS